MSDQDPGPLPELTSEQEATVRRLLAEARHEDPIPVEIGDRLDSVLADLSSGSSDESFGDPTGVVDLAARRRRRNAGRLLVAAAAVIVGGFAVGQVIDVGGTSDDSSDSAGSSVERQQLSSGDDAAAPSASGEAGGTGDGAELAKSLPLELTSESLQADVERQLPRGSAANLDSAEPVSPGALASYGAAFSCATAPPATYGMGRLYPAYYDGVPTVLAVRPTDGERQEAQVLECGTGTPLQSVTVSAP